MKNSLTLLCLCITFLLRAQTNEVENVKATIIEFFDAFHKQDTVKLKTMAKGDINMQSISINTEGKTVLQENSYSQFVRSIGSIPKDRSFKEELLGFNIQVDGNMANAWTPYEFWFDSSLSHCGVNSFQLMKENGSWKIIYLVDTRRREGCQD
ncbi:MAG: nuclear transport factor 2 family protein [Winogradskyella sp.]|uniref:nuclear transport factor 2 family protein n=1 Tax=Winogradskyella sp. TaxID=1883156 RepID=UPI001849DCCD|nr:nuclear transport factor 2 family protein [Winogradskyella sp.]